MASNEGLNVIRLFPEFDIKDSQRIEAYNNTS